MEETRKCATAAVAKGKQESEKTDMPVIKIFSNDQDGSHAAAAVMARTLVALPNPVEPTSARPKRIKGEKTRPGNPNKLVVHQHVFPSKSIGRFTNDNGFVEINDLLRGKIRRGKPRDQIFCADRAWDERTEASMKRIEDAFQKLVDPIANGAVTTIAPEQKSTVDEMYALWKTRALHRTLDAQEIELTGVAGETLTKEQQENLERNHYVFALEGGAMPARQLNGIHLQMRFGHEARSLADSVPRWGIIATQEGEFIVPDVPMHGIIPITPKLALVHSSGDGMITLRNLAEINQALRATSVAYCFVRDFSACPF